MIENRFKQALAAKKLQIGLWVAMANSYSAEMIGGAGFDWLLIDGEHAPNDIRSVLAQLQALAPYPTTPVVRLPIGQTHLVKQYLDLGAQTLLIPMVETAEEAKDLAAAVRYPPKGVRGVGSALARASRFNQVPDYLHVADQAISLLVQVESRRGVENIDAIAATDGIDGVFIGPSDLAADLGHLGKPEHPDVKARIDHAIKRILSAGKAPGILTLNETLAKEYIAQGVLFVAVGTDVSLLTKSAQALAGRFKA